MNELVYNKIKIAIISAQMNGMKYGTNRITDEAYESEQERIIDELASRLFGTVEKEETPEQENAYQGQTIN